MKYRVFLFMLFAVLVSNVRAQQWYSSSAPHGRDVSASAIPKPDAIVLGSGFEIAEQFEEYFLSTDYGLGWSVLSTDTPTSQVKSIAFKDSLNGYGVCYHGKIVKTTDGGNSWTKVDTIANRYFFKVIYVTPQTLYIAGGSRGQDTSAILKSVDGGNSWVEVYAQPGPWLKSITFTDNLHGFAVGDGAQILKTINGGSTWLPVAAPVANRSFNGVAFTTTTTGYIIGGRRDTATATILKTIDGGSNWTVVTDQPGGALNDITFINQNEGYIVGDSATLLKTIDGGQNWVAQTLPNTNTDQRINTVSFYSSTLGVIGGNGGYVMVYTVSSVPEATTEGVTVLADTTTANLNALVNTHGNQAAFTFYYSTDSTFATNVDGGYPISVLNNSPTLYAYTATNLLPDTTYYYMVQAYSLAGSVLGAKKSFYTRPAAYSFQTVGTANQSGSAITLLGSVNKLPYSTNLYFEYGTTQALGATLAANPSVVNDTLPHTVSAVLNSLLPNTTYYFRLAGSDGYINYIGNLYSFNTNQPAPQLTLFQTLSATNVTNNSAILNGLVKGFSDTVALSFEYGASLLFGSSVAAVPVSIADTLQYVVSATVSGLQTNTVYYYRMKGVTSAGATIYSDTTQVYTGNPQIPNWDFENWRHIIQEIPVQWYSFGGVVRTASYNSSNALYLYGDSFFPGGAAFNGIFFSTPFLFGSPFTAHPDSIILFASYDVAAGDTAFGLLYLNKNGVEIGRGLVGFWGNSGGGFTRMSSPISYSGSGNPDTAILAFATSINLFDGSGHSQNWLKVDDVSFSGTSQNIVNADFEDWNTVVYDLPDYWYTNGGEIPNNILTDLPVTRTTDAYSGQYAVRLETITTPFGVAPARVTTDKGGVPGTPPGFPVNYQCQSLNGYFKFYPDGGDTMNIDISMFKNGQRIGGGVLQLDSLVADYTPFSIPITYFPSGAIPDSATIHIRNCILEPRGNSVLYVDDLSFDGFTGFEQQPRAAGSFEPDGIKLYPNPASDNLVAEMREPFNEETTVRIYNLSGQLLKELILPAGERRSLINVKDVDPGSYQIRFVSGKKVLTKKIVVIK